MNITDIKDFLQIIVNMVLCIWIIYTNNRIDIIEYRIKEKDGD